MKMFDLYGDEWDETRDRDGWDHFGGELSGAITVPGIVEYLDTGKMSGRNAVGEPIMLARPVPTGEYWAGED